MKKEMKKDIKQETKTLTKIQEFEKFRENFLKKIDLQIDNLYKQRDYITEVLKKKGELRLKRISVWHKLIYTNIWMTLKYLISMPFIYGMIIPGIIMHITIEIYHHVCFRLYGIPLVNPKEYFIFDRRKLPHLNWLEKLNCAYCSYYNCLVSYMQEIVGRTERYWCPIKHAQRMQNPHKHYDMFTEYSDAEHLRKNWTELRRFKELKEKLKKD
ncbi:MAG: hypothetical protein ACLFN8_01270 [Candidatus Woesearchaeota archaeon]